HRYTAQRFSQKRYRLAETSRSPSLFGKPFVYCMEYLPLPKDHFMQGDLTDFDRALQSIIDSNWEQAAAIITTKPRLLLLENNDVGTLLHAIVGHQQANESAVAALGDILKAARNAGILSHIFALRTRQGYTPL